MIPVFIIYAEIKTPFSYAVPIVYILIIKTDYSYYIFKHIKGNVIHCSLLQQHCKIIWEVY